MALLMPFQTPISTHALREEGDRYPDGACKSHHYFYPRPPRGGRHNLATNTTAIIQFLPTPSARRATDALGDFCLSILPISTHAPREEGDATAVHIAVPNMQISTHALREEGDRLPQGTRPHSAEFLPTPSARRATYPSFQRHSCLLISTHALREEGDGKLGGGAHIR